MRGLIAVVLLLAFAPAASAQAPAPCNGITHVTDANDAAAADKDVLGVFFRFDDSKATANIKLESTTLTVAASVDAEAYWRVLYKTGDQGRWVGYRLSRLLPVSTPAEDWEYGTFTGDPENGGSYTTAGEATTGRILGDVLQIDIPAEAGGTSGTLLDDPYAVTSNGNPVDRAPDTGAGTDYSVGPCVPPPSQTDTDGDGVMDDKDNCRAEANAGQEDLDGDKAGDACDTDDDGDGLSDATEAGAGLNPRKQDSDGDGVRDDSDVCPHTPSANANGCPTSPNAPPVQAGGSGPSAGAVFITSASRRVKRGANYFVEGRVEPPRGSVPLEIAGIDRRGKVVTVANTLTSADGTFSTSLEVPATMAVLARVERTYSKPVLVFLIPSVTLSAKVQRRFGETFTGRFTGRATPSLNGRVTIQRQSGRRWVTVRSARVTRGRFAVTKAGLKSGRYRAQVVETNLPGVRAYSTARRLR